MQNSKSLREVLEAQIDAYAEQHPELTGEEIVEKFIPVPPEIYELRLAYKAALVKNKVYVPGITNEQRIDRTFGAKMSLRRNNMNLTQEDLSAALGRSVSAIKKIEKGNLTVRGKEELVDKICRELNWGRTAIYQQLGMGDVSTPKAISMNQAKNKFGHALQNSADYLNYFIEVFRIAEYYKVSFRKKTDEDIDQQLDEVSLLGKIDELRQVKYIKFFLDLIYDFDHKKSEKIKIAEEFFRSKPVRTLSAEDWKIVFARTERSVLKSMYDILLEMYENGKLGR